MLRITALMENSPSGNKALINEHGLSLMIDDGSHRILFDCGAGSHFIYNAHRLGIDLDNLDAVVISHSHYDHAAGFRDFAEAGYRAPALYVGEGFFERKYARKGLGYSDLSAGWDERFALASGFPVRAVKDCVEIFPGISLHQGFRRAHREETIPERFVKETARGFVPDDFSDEIALSIKTGNGLVIIAGCAHPGIMNMLDTIRDSSADRIYALIGGTHLVEADEGRIESCTSAIKAMGISIVGLCHCSGETAETMARKRLGDAFFDLSVGDTIII